MPFFETNGSSVVIPKWLLPILIGLFLTGTAAWAAVSFQAKSALPRIEAAQIYRTKIESREDQQRMDKRLTRIEDKLDKLLSR